MAACTEWKAVKAWPTLRRTACNEYAPSGRGYRGPQQEIGETCRLARRIDDCPVTRNER